MMSHAKVHLAVNYCILIGLVIIMSIIMHARLAGAATADAHAALALHLPNSLWRSICEIAICVRVGWFVTASVVLIL